MMMGVRHSRD